MCGPFTCLRRECTRERRPAVLRAAGRQSLKATFGIPTTAVCLVYAGRLSPEKNVSILPDMMARLLAVVPDAHLLLIGEGPERMRVAHSAAVSAPDRVHFHPHVVDRGALCELTAGADIFVHPNPREPFGIGPLEAMALGVPVVLPAAGGVLTYATDANAWLAVPGAEGLAAAVMRAVVNPAERRRRVDAARHTAARFAWPLAAERLLALHRAIHAERWRGPHNRRQAGRGAQLSSLRTRRPACCAAAVSYVSRRAPGIPMTAYSTASPSRSRTRGSSATSRACWSSCPATAMVPSLPSPTATCA